MTKLNIGVIGCGGIANQKHMPALAKLSELAAMTAFCDIDIEKAKKAAKEFGGTDARVFTDYQELLKDEPSTSSMCLRLTCSIRSLRSMRWRREST